MNKKAAIVFSRTAWSEPPRIRHQITNMLLDLGYEIFYVETLFHQKKTKNINLGPNHKIVVIRELFHHQLKICSLLSFLNKMFIKMQIASLRKVSVELIINFNYDFYYLNEIFPKSNLITILNDDFVSMAKPWMKKESTRLLKKTCQSSNKILSVSIPIHNNAYSFSKNAILFLPWADLNYQKPLMQKSRNVVLYFGYVSRLDLKLVDFICKSGVKIRFVGPLEGNGFVVKERYSKKANIEFIGPINNLNDIYLDDVCCSVALYDKNDESNLAITASNRMFRLLSLGIPLVYPSMPFLIEAPSNVIKKCDLAEDFIKAFNYFSNNFDLVQSEIEYFLHSHTYQTRKEQFLKFINN